jgi:hypothetical protein
MNMEYENIENEKHIMETALKWNIMTEFLETLFEMVFT